jgi:hypothetical protein
MQWLELYRGICSPYFVFNFHESISSMVKAIIGSCLLFFFIESVAQKQLQFIDRPYEATIKTIQVYPDKGNPNDMLNPAVTSIHEQNLLLEFDELKTSRSIFYAKLIHCNYDWSKSTLSDLDFMHDYNEFSITDYAFSTNTHLPYVHYRFQIPPVKLPGNYLLIVYRDGDKSDLALSKRLMIFDPQIAFSNDRQFLGTGAGRSTQPFNFTMNYSTVEIFNPLQSVHLVMLQNHRWDNAKYDLTPAFIRDNTNELEYRFFDDALSFQGNNEFRFVDFRSLNYPGQNTGNIDKSTKPFRLYVAEDRPRAEQAYSQYNDSNGNFIIDNLDTGDTKTGGNYLNVTFSLRPYRKHTDPIYVMGNFNQWYSNEENQMEYNLRTGCFEKTLLLKQGLYNYYYITTSKALPESEIEGSHFETENYYEVLVYNSTQQPHADLLLGYLVVVINQR